MFIQSFKATILFGALAIAGVMVYGVVVGPAWYIKAAVVLAVMSYVTQAVSTVEAQILDSILYRVASAAEADQDAGWDGRNDAARQSAMRWNKAAQVMWLATLLAGLCVVASMVLA